MTLRSKLGKAALGGGAAAMSLVGLMAAATPAAAQSGYYDSRGYYYDPCKRDQTERGTAGAVIGGIAGAVIGSNLASRGVRTEGAVLGGALGAAAGAAVGSNSAACRDGYSQAQPVPPPPQAYQNNGYYQGGYSGYPGYDGSVPYGEYANGPYYDNDYGYYDQGSSYGSGYYGSSYDRTYAYDGYGRSYAVTDRAPDASGCTLAESPIYLPDGNVQTRFVRVCRDRSGRYQVVE